MFLSTGLLRLTITTGQFIALAGIMLASNWQLALSIVLDDSFIGFLTGSTPRGSLDPMAAAFGG
jgi:hypothetical protein